MLLVGVGGIYVCGCKEVYRFHITYPYSSCICSFLQQHPYILLLKKMFIVLYIYREDFVQPGLHLGGQGGLLPPLEAQVPPLIISK